MPLFKTDGPKNFAGTRYFHANSDLFSFLDLKFLCANGVVSGSFRIIGSFSMKKQANKSKFGKICTRIANLSDSRMNGAANTGFYCIW